MSDDMINHPPHYKLGDREVIGITEHLDFLSGNVVKYVCRAGRKKGAPTTDDLLKALWYLKRKIRTTVNTSSMPLAADIDLVVDAHLVLRNIGVDLADVSAHKDLLFVEGDQLHYSIPHADDDGDIRWYEPRTTPWPSPARLNLMRAQYGLSLLDDARVGAVDAIRRLAAQVEAENNKKESTDE